MVLLRKALSKEVIPLIIACFNQYSFVRSHKVDFTTSGGIWYQELGRTTLVAAGDSISVTFTAKKYLKIIAQCIPSGIIASSVTFNGDNGANYSGRYYITSGSSGATASDTKLNFQDSGNEALLITGEISNLATVEKEGDFRIVTGQAGAANSPNHVIFAGKWANTAAQITTIAINNLGAGDFAIGSSLVVLGHD